MQSFMFPFFHVMNVPRQLFRQVLRQLSIDCDKYADTPAVIASKRMLDAAGVRYYKYNRTGRKITIEV